MNFATKYKDCVVIAIMFLLINLSFWLIAKYYGLDRALFNVDFLLLNLFFYYKNRFNAFLLFCVLFILCFIEVLLFGLQIFPFVGLNDIIYLSSFIFDGPVLYTFVVIFSIIAIVFVYYLINKFIYQNVNLTKRNWLAIFGVALTLLVISIMTNSNTAISQGYFLIKNRSFSMVDVVNDGRVLEELKSDYASKSLLEQIKNNQLKSNKILFIVSESWSETAKPEQQQAILKEIYEQKDKLEFIYQESFPVIGATVMGEVRELCQKRLMIMDAGRISSEELKDCIPNLLKQRGYETSSIHAASYGLYDRNIWYPLAGFKKTYFYPDLPESQKCLSFDGGCDIFLKDTIKKILLSSEKSFVYWLTLNSHAPYNDKIFINDFDCDTVGLETGTAACNNYKLHYQFFTMLAQMIRDPKLKGLEVYVVGDHPAPITDLKDGLKAFKGTDVAWLHFKIKDNE